jgi:hypothetical protein
MSTDWNAQLAIGGLFKSLFSGIEGLLARQAIGESTEGAATTVATQTTESTAATQSAKTVGGKITGFTKHGINQAISRDGFGVATRAIRDAVANPIKVVLQSGGRVKYIGKEATVILNQAGKVITTWARNSAGRRISP